MTIFIIILCSLVVIGLIFMIIANRKLGEYELKKVETQNEIEEREFKEKIEKINPDKLIGNKKSWVAFKDNKLIGSLIECSLNNSAYIIGDGRIIILSPTPNGINIIPSLGDKEDQEIIGYLDKINVPMVQYSFVIHETDDLRDYVTFNTDVECAYKTDKKEKFFSISGSKNPNLKWKLTNVEFTPHYVTDYEVTTKSEETGRVGGHAGAATIGGLIGGTTGAVIGSSLGRNVNTTTVSHSTNSANSREVPSIALLTLESQSGDAVKISEELYEEDIVSLKKYFLVEETEDNTGKPGLVGELKKLKDMVDEGILSQEEFEQGKKKLLNS